MALKQGNRGSGNRKSSYGKAKDAVPSRDMAQHLMEENEGFRKKVELKTEEAWEIATSFLLSVAKGEFKQEIEVWDKKNSEVVKITERASIESRIKAAKVLKEYTLDKTLADKKDKDKGQGGGSAADLVKALQEIEGRRKAEAERVALEAGKLAKIGDKSKSGG